MLQTSGWHQTQKLIKQGYCKTRCVDWILAGSVDHREPTMNMGFHLWAQCFVDFRCQAARAQRLYSPSRRHVKTVFVVCHCIALKDFLFISEGRPSLREEFCNKTSAVLPTSIPWQHLRAISTSCSTDAQRSLNDIVQSHTPKLLKAAHMSVRLCPCNTHVQHGFCMRDQCTTATHG